MVAIHEFKQWCTDLRFTLTTILHEERQKSPYALIINAVFDNPPFASGTQEARPCQHSQMSRHGVLNHVQALGDFSCRQAVRGQFHQEPEGVEPGSLAQSGKSHQRFRFIHISKLTDELIQTDANGCRETRSGNTGIQHLRVGRHPSSLDRLGMRFRADRSEILDTCIRASDKSPGTYRPAQRRQARQTPVSYGNR